MMFAFSVIGLLMVARTIKQMNEWMDGRIGELVKEKNGWINGWTDEWMEESLMKAYSSVSWH